jgi:hypothetical protein
VYDDEYMKTAQAQQIFHGSVGQDKYAGARVRAASDQPVMVSDTPRTPPLNTSGARPQKHSTRRRKHQIASWVDDPILWKLQRKAAEKRLSMSTTVRRLLRQVLSTDDETVDAALLPEMIEQSVARANRRIVAGLATFLVRIVFELGDIKAFSTNTLERV